MMRIFGTVALGLSLLAGTAAAEAPKAKKSAGVVWTLDKAHTNVGFTARHLAFSKVKGEFSGFDATIKADPKTAKLTALTATAKADSVDTGIEKRDDHLKSGDFFDAKKFPEIKLVLKSIKWSGKKFTAKVHFTLHGVTKPITFKGELLGVNKVNFGKGDQLHAGYEASAKISRKAFGLKFNGVVEGVSVVSDEVEVHFNAELIRKL